ncbi:hypothetical protein F5Y14DRAFT_206515 [Nemania sp. NC0429]|nr:hypothetical protein F5Y14DRAFT_206515 [Nemania sp. NC0429]
MDQNWDTDKLNRSDLPSKVVSIHLVAYPNSNNEGDEKLLLPPTNHWCLFLELIDSSSGDSSSVRFDMAPGYGSDGLRGKIEVSSKEYNCTSNRIHRITFQVIAPVSVAMIVELVQKNGRQKYQFSPEWEGCRFWNYTFLQDLEKAGIILEGSSEKAEEALSSYFRTPSGVEKREMRIGEFRA